MKISIWRQFSSNHSDSFTVVGKFASEEDALKATNKLKQLLEDIRRLQGRDYHMAMDIEPVDAEIEAGKEFDIEWTEHLDWIHRDASAYVHQIEKYVSVSGEETWQGARYIDQIMKKLAVEAYVEEEMGLYKLGVVLVCHAPSLDVANEMNEEMKQYLFEVRAEREHIAIPPWRPDTLAMKDDPDGFSSSFDDAAWYGYVEQKGTHLNWHHLTFGEIGIGLPSMLAYLKRRGCKAIEYTISQELMRDVYEE